MVRTLAICLSFAFLAGCSAPGSSSAPPLPSGGTSHDRSPQDGASALPGGDGASALPGGDGASALPGVVAACDPKVPAGLVSCSLALSVNAGAIKNLQLPRSLVPGYHPADLQAAYGLTGGSATTVAIVDAYDDPGAETDLAIYRTTFGLPLCTSLNGCFRKIDEHGGTRYPAFNMGWSEEIAIDTEMVSAVCPKCKILLVEANSASMDDLSAAVDTAVAHGARVVSNSYYAPEWSGELAYDLHYNHSGVAMTASSGDAMYASYPAVSPYVTSVGGTTLTKNGSTFAQQVWTNTGHGCSAYEPRPSWQASLSACATKSSVDVAAVADPIQGVSMFDLTAGGWLVAGGTSIGAPIVAAAYGLASNGATTPYVYAHSSSLTHIENGSFGIYTGLGSPAGITAF